MASEPGIHISDGLADDGVHKFVYAYSPQFAPGAIVGCVPPIGLAPRDS